MRPCRAAASIGVLERAAGELPTLARTAPLEITLEPCTARACGYNVQYPMIALDLLRSQLKSLRRRDFLRTVFGARHHRYHSTKLTPGDMVNLARRLRVWLPREYFQFMLEIGYGAGPYYGLLSPRDVLSTLRGTGPSIPKPWRPFHFSRADLVDYEQRTGDWEHRALRARFPCDGGILIGSRGCTYYSMLVTTGEFAGTVWDAGYFVTGEGYYVPAGRPRASLRSAGQAAQVQPPTFTEWYASWIDNALSNLSPLTSLWRRLLGWG
jgi:hypothetical protein